ncbi:MAG: tRNA (N6-isopentenyl adenosine(37)-C2)-methylthiotransferase MiaB [Nitrospirae bacterium]|nr:tRNA (N6-isopentenyl adenosine(37)-C2)-methylthiotransferase MiaB [Candidatus Troglogloeales bacterium]
MNVADSELIRSILIAKGHQMTSSANDAEVVLMNTCAIRENAHRKIYGRLDILRPLKKQREAEHRPFVVGVLGCMAQNLKEELLMHPVANLVVGPDNYRALPNLIDRIVQTNHHEVEASLSEYETYSDIAPTRIEGVNAWVTIMRGCDNFCAFCVVPYTRGRERSRSIPSILNELEQLVAAGYPQVTLLGQNVNSYCHEGETFADLIVKAAQIPGLKRIRFTSPHPKDFSEKLLYAIAEYPNICNHIHLPLQSGSDRILNLMNRTYTSAEYLGLVKTIRRVIPTTTLTTDMIVGFPTETEKDFQETVQLMDAVQFDNAFIFKYSERKGTIAARDYPDDVAEVDKTNRIVRLNNIQHEIAFAKHRCYSWQTVRVLIEGSADKGINQQMGKTAGNLTVVFPKTAFNPGEFVSVRVTETTTGALYGEVIE